MRKVSFRWQAVSLGAALTISAVCLLATYCVVELAEHGPRKLKWVLYLLTLSVENNFGAWWSSFLLLAGSLLAVDAGLHARAAGQPAINRAWWALATVLLIFSIDEGASIHERVGDWIGLGDWGSRAPFGAAVGLLLFYGLVTLWRSASHRSLAVWLAAGFALLATVPVQEKLEVSHAWLAGHVGLRAALEEGTEITGMLILLTATLRGASGALASGQDSRAFAFVDRCRRPVLLGCILLAPVIAELSAVLPDQTRGRPAAWFASALAIFGALSLLRGLIHEGLALRAREMALVGLAFLLSIESFTFDLMANPNRRVIVSATFVLFALLHSWWPGRVRTYADFWITVVAAAVAIATFSSHTLVVLNIAIIAAGLAIWFGSASPGLHAAASGGVTSIRNLTGANTTRTAKP